MVMHELLMYGFTASSAGCAATLVYPALARWWTRSASRVERYHQVRVEHAVKTLDDLFIEVKPSRLHLAYGVGPLAIGALAFALSRSVILALVGVAAGIVALDWWITQATAIRRRQFKAQLMDALFLLSSSLRAGLSMTQAFEQLETEMSPPASQEFGLMMRAHQLGLTFEEALQRLNARMACEELHLLTTAVLVARETGGNVTTLLQGLVGTIRERKKLSDKVKTLTLQGRLQAYVMSALPALFVVFVQTFQPNHFTLLIEEPTGQIALVIAASLWLAGMWLLMKMSKVNA
ncbi:MAG: type II secretion system F family protein [Candidatus Omnitrophota bacterium]|nr:type II secretion system F family protein [Candidatus Omnitrophota bacterium]